MLRQNLHFKPDDLVLPLPFQVEAIHKQIEHYVAQFGKEPRIEVCGHFESIAGKYVGRVVVASDWCQIAAYDEASNALALFVLGAGEARNANVLEWVQQRSFSEHERKGNKLRLYTKPEA